MIFDLLFFRFFPKVANKPLPSGSVGRSWKLIRHPCLREMSALHRIANISARKYSFLLLFTSHPECHV